MVAAISIDLRRRVVEAHKAGEGGYKKLAVRFKLSWNSVRRWVQLDRTQHSLAPKPHTAGPPIKIPESKWPELRMLVAEKPDRSLRELVAEWKKRHGVCVHVSSMSRVLIKAGLHFKKRHLGLQSETGPTS